MTLSKEQNVLFFTQSLYLFVFLSNQPELSLSE
jgi:hypothetical protein